MICYYDLSIPLRSLMILGLFLVFCCGGWLLHASSQRKTRAAAPVALLGMLLSGSLMILYSAEARANLRGLAVPAVSDRLCSAPLIVPFLVFLAVLTAFFRLLQKERTFRKHTITQDSVREGVDKISSGLCFYTDGGRIILANRRMTALCFAITGHDLQNAEHFLHILREGEVLPEVERLSAGEQPAFRLPDGSVWVFAYRALDGLHQLTAADTTQLQMVTDALRETNKELGALNLRLRKHGENVDELTRSRERLETKTRIHSELGQALLSARRFLLEEDAAHDPPLALWQRSIAMLRKEAECKADEQPLEMLSRIALSTGISIEVSGALPQDREVQKLFVQAAAEALTNAISHAHAKNLYMALQSDAENYTARFTNDGDAPKEITEGGGLGSLRRKLEDEGGTMRVLTEPQFALVITLPKGKGEVYGQGTAC